MLNKVVEIVENSLCNATVVSAIKKNADTYIALVNRANMDDERAYSTHEVNVTNGCMYYGHYDMSFEAATKSLTERA